MKNRLLITTVFALAAILLVVSTGDMLWAQPPGMPGAPDQAPIDGGLGILAAGGAAYAMRKFRSRKG